MDFFFILAIFLDPRYQCLLDEFEISNGINHLVLTWNALLQLSKSEDDLDDEINFNDSYPGKNNLMLIV